MSRKNSPITSRSHSDITTRKTSGSDTQQSSKVNGLYYGNLSTSTTIQNTPLSNQSTPITSNQSTPRKSLNTFMSKTMTNQSVIKAALDFKKRHPMGTRYYSKESPISVAYIQHISTEEATRDQMTALKSQTTRQNQLVEVALTVIRDQELSDPFVPQYEMVVTDVFVDKPPQSDGSRPPHKFQRNDGKGVEPYYKPIIYVWSHYNQYKNYSNSDVYQLMVAEIDIKADSSNPAYRRTPQETGANMVYQISLKLVKQLIKSLAENGPVKFESIYSSDLLETITFLSNKTGSIEDYVGREDEVPDEQWRAWKLDHPYQVKFHESPPKTIVHEMFCISNEDRVMRPAGGKPSSGNNSARGNISARATSDAVVAQYITSYNSHLQQQTYILRK